MRTFPEVFGTNTFATQIEPRSLAIMIAAAAFNLTGARNIKEDAFQYSDSRAAIIATAFAECALYVQRIYKEKPHARIVVLATSAENGAPCSAVVVDEAGELIFDPKKSSFAYCIGGYRYGYTVGNTVIEYVAASSVSIYAAVDELSKAGFWVDRAWNWHEPKPRASDYL